MSSLHSRTSHPGPPTLRTSTTICLSFVYHSSRKHHTLCNTEPHRVIAARCTAADEMQNSASNLGTLFVSLPAELRIDIYERVFNASLDNSLLPNSFDRRPMQKAMLRTLHINRAIRNDSKKICTSLAKRHLEALEAGILADETTYSELVAICRLRFYPPLVNHGWDSQSFEDRVRRISDLTLKISDDAKKVAALSELLPILETPRRGRLYVSWLNMRRRLRILVRDAKQKIDPSVRTMVDGRH